MSTAAQSDDAPSVRINLDPEDVGRGLGQIVLAILDTLRELLERQAIRRVESGDLDDAQIERLGSALRSVRDQISELSESLSRSDRESIGAILGPNSVWSSPRTGKDAS
jgi:gas vesicle protein GvpK